MKAELLKQGYAEVMTAPPNVRYEQLFVERQRDARRHKRGLWADRQLSL